MSLTKMGGQVALTVTPEDLHHFANALLAQSRKEWELVLDNLVHQVGLLVNRQITSQSCIM